jgi:hypothetical protein
VGISITFLSWETIKQKRYQLISPDLPIYITEQFRPQRNASNFMITLPAST